MEFIQEAHSAEHRFLNTQVKAGVCKDITFNCALNLGAGLPSGWEIGEVSAHSEKGAISWGN